MKKLLALSVVAALGFQTAHATTQAGLAFCPQSAENTIDQFHSSSLYVGKVRVDVASGGSEPNFSSEIIWDHQGVVTLVRKNKEAIVLGQGVRPAQSSNCGIFPFTVSDKIQIEASSRGGIPFPVCSLDSGCEVVHPKNDKIIIHTESESITYVGHWG